MDEIWLISEGTSRLKAFCTPFINQKITHSYCFQVAKDNFTLMNFSPTRKNYQSLRLRYGGD